MVICIFIFLGRQLTIRRRKLLRRIAHPTGIYHSRAYLNSLLQIMLTKLNDMLGAYNLDFGGGGEGSESELIVATHILSFVS